MVIPEWLKKGQTHEVEAKKRRNIQYSDKNGTQASCLHLYLLNFFSSIQKIKTFRQNHCRQTTRKGGLSNLFYFAYVLTLPRVLIVILYLLILPSPPALTLNANIANTTIAYLFFIYPPIYSTVTLLAKFLG